MDTLISHLQTINSMNLIKLSGVLLLPILVFSLVGRFIFGKRSTLNASISTAIGIIFVYALTVVIYCLEWNNSIPVADFPLVTITREQLTLFSFEDTHYTTICAELASMIILAFFVGIVDMWIPAGKNLFSWIFFRCLTVVIAFILHLLINWVANTYLPEGITIYAPTILLGLLIVMLLTGALKFLVGIILSTVNPLIGALYTFFFANTIGKIITKAVLTTTILAGFVWLLNHLGLVAIVITSAALIAYIPFLILLSILWYLVHNKL